MNKKTWLFAVLLILGIALIGLSFIFKADSTKAVQGIMLGIGAGLMGMSLARLSMIKHVENNPDLGRQAEIDMKDERNVMIRAKAKAASADVTRWFIMSLAFLMILINAPLWTTLCVVGVYLLYHVLALVFMSYYQKKM